MTQTATMKDGVINKGWLYWSQCSDQGSAIPANGAPV
jgi:hypothetical protein